LAANESGDAVVCTLRSPHGEQGFPGTVDVAVTYRIEGPRSLAIDFYAETDRETILSLANHAYFNLGDEDTIDDHTLLLHADEYTPADASLIPTGAIDPVDGTAFDLREPTSLGGASPRVFDTNFVVRGGAGLLREAAVLAATSSGLAMRIETTEPGLQLYTGDYLNEPFHPRQGVCLEAQNFPDAPNQPGFPSARLLPGAPYRSTTVLTFDSKTR
ncbi:MAG: aldose epimerase family protein, partial [Pseudomonadota bacterium]